MDKILYFDICAIMVVLVLLYATFSRKRIQGKTNRYFIILLCATGLSAVCDIWSEAYGIWLPVGECSACIREILVYGYFLTHNLCALVYNLYLISLTNTWDKIKERISLKLILILPYTIIILTLLFNMCTHKIFYINEACEYVRGEYILILYACAAVYMIFGVVYSLAYRKLFSKELFIALMSIFPMELLAVIIQWFFPNVLIEVFMTSIANMMVMVSIHGPEENENKLIGAKNYYAYMTDLKRGILNQKKMGIIIVKIVNYWSFYSALGYDTYNEIFNRIRQEIAAVLKQEKVYTHMYYIDNGRLALVLDKFDRNKAEALVEKINERLKAQELAEWLNVELEPSICYFRYPEDIDNLKAIISFGEKFYHLIKNPLGVIYASDINSNDMHLSNEIDMIIHDALLNEKFEVYYQPIYSVEKNKYISAEALIRLNTEKYGFVPPELITTAAEKTGAINQIGEFVLNTVCEFISSDEFKKTGLEYIEVNLSAVEYMQIDIAERVLNITESHDVPADKINLEITETAFSSSHGRVMENINKLSKAGFTFSLDDYGIGYSNIQKVVSLPLKIVKIDKCFVDEVGNDRMYGVIKNNIKMFKDMNLEIVVEGVETKEISDKFIDLDCEFIQGYYYSRPLPKHQFIDFCESHYKAE